MFNSDDQDIIAAFNELGLTYRWEQLNIDLNPELHKRQFQLITHFYYKSGQAPTTPEVINYHILKNFNVLLKLIQLKQLNVKYYYVKIFTEDNNPLISDSIRELDGNVLLHDIDWVLEYALNPDNTSPFLLSTDEHPRYIIEIRFIFTLIEDFFDI
jgi:hypothetical protein